MKGAGYVLCSIPHATDKEGITMSVSSDTARRCILAIQQIENGEYNNYGFQAGSIPSVIRCISKLSRFMMNILARSSTTAE